MGKHVSQKSAISVSLLFRTKIIDSAGRLSTTLALGLGILYSALHLNQLNSALIHPQKYEEVTSSFSRDFVRVSRIHRARAR